MSNWNRRQFLAATPAAALSARRASGANDRVRVAVIGCGGRNLLREVLQLRNEANVQVVAVCDTWKPQREKAAAAVKEATDAEPRMVARYQDVLAMNDVDAVLISSPDHTHCTILRDAVRAGKDVYVEKPLAMNMDELVDAVDVVKGSGRVVQVGTQLRSTPAAASGRAFLASGGLGSIFKIEQSRNMYRPYWHQYTKPVEEADVDWRAFLLNRKSRPFDPDQYSTWYGYRDFSLGPQTGFMSHFIDLVHFVTGARFPKSAVGMGGTYRWKDPRTAPDSFEAVLEYPEGFLVRYSTVFGTNNNNFVKFFGTRGVMDASQGTKVWQLIGERSDPEGIPAGAVIPPVEATPHMKNWLDCIRSRQEPIAPIEAGYQHSVACLMADESWVQGARMVYDPVKRKIRKA